MKVSIITICYNRAQTIQKCIESVLQQNHSNIEYIVIDGNSKDGTQQIIGSFGNQVTHFVSEPDQGMYDAINKGLAIATGDVIGLLHSDDTFYDEKVVSKIVKAFENNPQIDGLYGNGIYTTNDNEQRLVRNRIGGNFHINRIKTGWLPLHPTVYLKKEVFEKYGGYNLNFKIASDTEFLLRYLYKYRIRMHYLNEYIVKMRMGGLSTTASHAIKVLQEDYRIYKFHGLVAPIAVVCKKSRAVLEYLKK